MFPIKFQLLPDGMVQTFVSEEAARNHWEIGAKVASQWSESGVTLPIFTIIGNQAFVKDIEGGISSRVLAYGLRLIGIEEEEKSE